MSPAKISLRERMTLFCDFRTVLVQEENYDDFKGTCFWRFKTYSRILQVKWTDGQLYVVATCQK